MVEFQVNGWISTKEMRRDCKYHLASGLHGHFIAKRTNIRPCTVPNNWPFSIVQLRVEFNHGGRCQPVPWAWSQERHVGDGKSKPPRGLFSPKKVKSQDENGTTRNENKLGNAPASKKIEEETQTTPRNSIRMASVFLGLKDKQIRKLFARSSTKKMTSDLTTISLPLVVLKWSHFLVSTTP